MLYDFILYFSYYYSVTKVGLENKLALFFGQKYSDGTCPRYS